MENEAGMSASVKTVDGVLMFLRREFAIMQILEKGSGMPLLFVGHVQIAVQGSGIAENGGKYSVQVFGSCSPFSNLPIRHTRTKEQAMPGNQIRH